MENKSTNTQIPKHTLVALRKVMKSPFNDNGLSDHIKISRITRYFEKIMITMGLDLTDDSLKDTPKRIAKMYIKEFFSGLKEENFPKITTIENKMKCDEMISVNKIRVLSVCEHHFVTIDGFATVAYIPNDKVIGLSKINRIVEYFAKRPQVQERLVKQIADCMVAILGTKNVAVHINAKHYCVISRGIKDTGSYTITNDLRGLFKTDTSLRSEFLSSIKNEY